MKVNCIELRFCSSPDGGSWVGGCIYEIRGERIMLDFDLSNLYEVGTKVLNQAVKRNFKRFPEDFMFRLTSSEWQDMPSQIATSENNKQNMRSQFVTASQNKRNTTVIPYAFTE